MQPCGHRSPEWQPLAVPCNTTSINLIYHFTSFNILPTHPQLSHRAYALVFAKLYPFIPVEKQSLVLD